MKLEIFEDIIVFQRLSLIIAPEQYFVLYTLYSLNVQQSSNNHYMVEYR